MTTPKRNPPKDKVKLFRFPEDLQDDVAETLAALRAVVPLEVLNLYLEAWHRGPSRPADGLSRVMIPVEVQLLLDRYSRACARLARYNKPGGPARHVSAGVERELNRLRGKGSKRGRKIPYEAIVADLDAMDYVHARHGHKKKKKSELAKKHNVSESSVTTAIIA